MSFASSSSSACMAIRSAARGSKRTISTLGFMHRSSSVVRDPQMSRRNYATEQIHSPSASTSQTPFAQELSSGLSESHTPPPSSPSRPTSFNSRGHSDLTAGQAQEFLSDLLHLPPSRQFPPKLALQILTHKSYRFTSIPKYISSTNPPTLAERENNFMAAHNARLSFLGRRAFETYLAMFVHAAVAVSGVPLSELDFLRGKTLEEKLENMRNTKNLGRTIGPKWDMRSVVRWDGNHNGGELAVDGQAVEAILGAIFTEFGSPAAHRMFHLMMLPHLSPQLRDPVLRERAEKMRAELESEMAGGILVEPESEMVGDIPVEQESEMAGDIPVGQEGEMAEGNVVEQEGEIAGDDLVKP